MNKVTIVENKHAREKLFKTAKEWGLEGDSAKIFERLKNWETVSVETLPLRHGNGEIADKGGKRFTITPKPLMKECADEIGSRGYVTSNKDGSPIFNVQQLAEWVSRLKLAD